MDLLAPCLFRDRTEHCRQIVSTHRWEAKLPVFFFIGNPVKSFVLLTYSGASLIAKPHIVSFFYQSYRQAAIDGFSVIFEPISAFVSHSMHDKNRFTLRNIACAMLDTFWKQSKKIENVAIVGVHFMISPIVALSIFFHSVVHLCNVRPHYRLKTS